MVATFDTLRSVKRLRGAGVPEAQAETTVEVIGESQSHLVTKEDLYLALLIQTGVILGGVAVLTQL
ncbi:MAG: DUF1640 domain-containing protein [Chloroflexi bacterium]|nr:DUF1640 domain-containing protein [Chloroflexota bacterium]